VSGPLDLEAGLRETLRPIVAELVREELDRRLDALSGPEWLTVEEYAERRRTTAAAVYKRIERGWIPEAVRDGKRWLIPGTLETMRENPNKRGERR
jgi:hypothetical protein